MHSRAERLERQAPGRGEASEVTRTARETAPLHLYTLRDLATLTGLSRDSLDREIRDGKLTATRIRSRVYVRAENLEAWIYRCESRPAEKSGACRVPLAFRSKQERLRAARELRARAIAEVRS
jgi:excisionase family DNA binding protein